MGERDLEWENGWGNVTKWSEAMTSELRRKKEAGTTNVTGLAPSGNLQKPVRLGLHEEEGRMKVARINSTGTRCME